MKIILTLSRRRLLLYRNQSTDLRSKSMDRFLCDNGPRLERVKSLMASFVSDWQTYRTRKQHNSLQRKN